MKHPFIELLGRWAVLALGVVLATWLVPGIRCDDGLTLLSVVLLLSLANAIVRPLLVLFTLPFIVLTLGLGVMVINALLFLGVAWLVKGFHVAGFWSALGGSIVVSITHLLLSGFFPKKRRSRGPAADAARGGGKSGDVIDI